MNSKKYIAIVSGFLVTLISNTILALFVLAPFNQNIGISRTMEQGLNSPALLSGYFLVAIFMVVLVSNLKDEHWFNRGLKLGLLTALSFNVAGYMVVSGWSVASAPWMLFASIVDSIATILGALTISYSLRNK